MKKELTNSRSESHLLNQEGNHEAQLPIDKADQDSQDIGIEGILAGVRTSISAGIDMITAKHDMKQRKHKPDHLVADLQDCEELLRAQLEEVGMIIDKALK